MKCNQSGPEFELVSPCPHPATITITPRAPVTVSIEQGHCYERACLFFDCWNTENVCWLRGRSADFIEWDVSKEKIREKDPRSCVVIARHVELFPKGYLRQIGLSPLI